jgi:hypothetical protein
MIDEGFTIQREKPKRSVSVQRRQARPNGGAKLQNLRRLPLAFECSSTPTVEIVKAPAQARRESENNLKNEHRFRLHHLDPIKLNDTTRDFF